MKTMLLTALAITTMTSIVCADKFTDDFSKAKMKGRTAERGDWKFEGKQTTCVSDPKLYKKFKNHGPILKWPGKFKDAAIEFEMKANNCQRVVFTLNGDGHIFRVIMGGKPPTDVKGVPSPASRIIGWKTKSSKQNKGDTFKPKGIPNLAKLNSKWVKVRVEVKGDHADLSIGDFKTKIDHASLAREKSQVTLSFAFGDIAVRNFNMVTP